MFFTIKKVWKNMKISLQTKIRILEDTVNIGRYSGQIGV